MRVHVASLSGASAGSVVPLEADQARHLVRVRRLGAGADVEVFDDAGRSAPAVLEEAPGGRWLLRLGQAPSHGPAPGPRLSIYAAAPKGQRADWMVEKLSELGTAELVLLNTARSVAEPGAGRLERFARLARESAKQSRRSGVMHVSGPVSLESALAAWRAGGGAGAVLTTERPGEPLAQQHVQAVFIGPEGGWTEAELDMLLAAGLAPARLTATILRIETAAICAAALALAQGHAPGPGLGNIGP